MCGNEQGPSGSTQREAATCRPRCRHIPAQSHAQYRADIDGLRALAVVPVVLFHTRLGPVTGGFVGVDVFFVISGFLITELIRRQVDGGRCHVLLQMGN